ncbi:MAG: hypothetical protein AAGD43_07665 [Pseudomonadota bacterium]
MMQITGSWIETDVRREKGDVNELLSWRFNVCGWILFVLSALGYCWSSIQAGDPVSLIASLLFLIACLVFLVPLMANRPNQRG